jgi:hypothetical protein
MGAGQSIPQSLPSAQKYRGQVIPTQILVNEIFLWMMSQMDTNDLLKLANPKHCKDYVFLTKESLDVFMKQIQLEPRMGAKNVLYFSSVKDLTFADEKAAEQRPTPKLYRDALCSQLAFFYVRLFQIFGALALTVIDSLPDVGPKVGDIRAAALVPGVRGQRPPLFAVTGGAKIGPADRANLGDFYEFAQPYFSRMDSQDDVYVISSQSGRGQKQYRPQDKDVIFFYASQNQNILYQIANSTVEARINITNASKASYTLVVDNIVVNDESTSVSYNVPMTFKVNDYLYGRRNFYSVLYALLNASVRATTRGKSIEEILGERREGDKAEAKVDEAGIPEGLSYIRIRDYLKEKPKAYCVARAIQLLSPTLMDGIRKETRFGSDVCYFDSPEGYMKDSVPLFNHPITDNTPGIRALNQLFYDILKGTSPGMSAEADARHREFISLMQQIFSPKEQKKDLKAIKDVRSYPFTQCDEPELKNKKIVLTNQNSIREVQKAVAELLNYQMRHTATVTKFLQKLFLVEKSGRVAGIHPSILKGGLPAVNKLAEEARVMLTEYYKFCEGSYRLGALKVLGAQDKIVLDRIK